MSLRLASRPTAAAAVLALLALGNPARAAEPIRVAATIFPLADIAARVGGTAVEVMTLLPAGASPHTYEPKPEQVRALQSAQLLIRVGAGVDDWVDRLLGSGGPVVTATGGIDLIDGGGHGRGDPHVWLDPHLVEQQIVPAIETALEKIAPDRRQELAANAAGYQRQLAQLDDQIMRAAHGWKHPEYVSLHQSWRYFARRYGLRQVGVIEESPGKEPSARAIAELVQRARQAQARIVLVEPQLSRRAAEILAAEFGGVLVTVDPLGGPSLPGRDSYLKLMRFNLEALSHAFE